MNYSRAIGLFFAILATSFVVALSMQSYTRQIPSTGTITAVGVNVFSDAACTQNLTSVNWGVLTPGSLANYQMYIKSTSNVPITLSLGTDSWNPAAAATYITLTWSYAAGTVIQPNASLPVTLTLTVSSSVAGFTSFSFNIDVTGSG
ncbi:MAG: hypothetical protein ABSD73_05695 [Candidatus Bathyarchaeia archaeon]|jgi:hypothetical protein